MAGGEVNILSIQSWVTCGHVGNASAMFPLQRLGAEVWAIHTVQFSNHPGHGGFTGQAFPAPAVTDLLDGLQAHGVLPGCDAVLSGYLGEAATGFAILDAVARVRAANPGALYACDPVIGDAGRGIYVRAGIAEFFAASALPCADLLTPNQFELEILAGRRCATLTDARAAVADLQGRMAPSGPRIVLVTSLRVEDTPADAIDLLLGAGDGYFRARVPLLPVAASGAGDLMAALFLFHVLRTGDAVAAMELAASSVHGVLRWNCRENMRELCLVAAQDEIVTPSMRLVAQPC